jgi:hypothetical protein
MNEAQCAQNAAQAPLNPYKACTMMALLPASMPNSASRIVHTSLVMRAEDIPDLNIEIIPGSQ